jgi:hypothetical protein
VAEQTSLGIPPFHSIGNSSRESFGESSSDLESLKVVTAIQREENEGNESLVHDAYIYQYSDFLS